MEEDYTDIIHLQHPTSRRHPRMPLIQRAAQFAPFAALTGHSEAIEETAHNFEKNSHHSIHPTKNNRIFVTRNTH